MAGLTFTMAVGCAVAEVAVYWLVGFTVERRMGRYDVEETVVNRWGVGYVMVWGSVVAAGWAVLFLWTLLKSGVGMGTEYRMMGDGRGMGCR